MTTLTWDEVDSMLKSNFWTRGSKYDSRVLADLSCTKEHLAFLINTDDLYERMMIVREYIEAYLVLKGRINRVKHLEIVQQYISQQSMIGTLKKESEKLNAIILTKDNL